MKRTAICITVLLGIALGGSLVEAAMITQLSSPGEFIYPVTTIDFDDGPGGTIANMRYVSQGIEFSRDDGYIIPLLDWQGIGRVTSSPPNVIATIKWGSAPIWTTHLNVTFSSATYEVGAFFGNDQGWDYTETTLTVFDPVGVNLGSVTVPANNNASVDQFIGLRSDLPFQFARFENGGVTFSVVLDDLAFAVPEPGTILLLGLGGLGVVRRRRGNRIDS